MFLFLCLFSFQLLVDYPSDLWKLDVFLSPNSDGSGGRITEQNVHLYHEEAMDGVSYTYPLEFNGKEVVLNMTDKLCPAGDMYICAQLTELPNAEPDCTIDTTNAIACEMIECRGKFNPILLPPIWAVFSVL